MLAFFQCVAESVVENGLRGLVEMVPGGAYACAVAGGAWKKYRERKREDAIREEIQQLAQSNFDEARVAAIEAVKAAIPPSTPAEERISLELYLSQVPGTVRASLKRPDDTRGKTVPSAFALAAADDVLRLLPPCPPRFRPGGELPGRSDWTLNELLGTGGFGEVWKVTHQLISPRAVKFCTNPGARERLINHEGAIISRVMQAGEHAGIVPLRDALLRGDTPWLMYDYVPDGDLADVILQWQKLDREQRIRQVVKAMKQLSDAVAHFSLSGAIARSPRFEASKHPRRSREEGPQNYRFWNRGGGCQSCS